ncbi:MAG: hypothetical protein IH856_24250 [Deltaproteobacteria bacterium]|nr:hypothetical protein [Deltaproteobacteria bacterium]MCZ6547251.1 hypothetical protein [Deltaproteobacteria bacterium]
MTVIILLGNPAACRGHITGGVFPGGRYNVISALGQCLTEEDLAHPDKSDEIGDLYLTDA